MYAQTRKLEPHSICMASYGYFDHTTGRKEELEYAIQDLCLGVKALAFSLKMIDVC